MALSRKREFRTTQPHPFQQGHWNGYRLVNLRIFIAPSRRGTFKSLLNKFFLTKAVTIPLQGEKQITLGLLALGFLVFKESSCSWCVCGRRGWGAGPFDLYLLGSLLILFSAGPAPSHQNSRVLTWRLQPRGILHPVHSPESQHSRHPALKACPWIYSGTGCSKTLPEGLGGQNYFHSNTNVFCPFHCVDICAEVKSNRGNTSALVWIRNCVLGIMTLSTATLSH